MTTMIEPIVDNYEDCPFRDIRLHQFIGCMAGILQRGGHRIGMIAEFVPSLMAVHDHKGNCFVLWRVKPTPPMISAADVAWQMADGGDGPTQYFMGVRGMERLTNQNQFDEDFAMQYYNAFKDLEEAAQAFNA